jgi:hypothetical protein
MELRPFLISLLMFGLLAFSVITGGILIASENNANQSIGDNTALKDYASSLNSNLSTTQDTASSADASFQNSTVTLAGGWVFLDVLGGLWKTLKTAPMAVYSLSANVIRTQLLGDTVFNVVFGVIGFIIVITLIFAVWKLLRVGEGG